MKFITSIIFVLCFSLSSFSQVLSWDLSSDGVGVSTNQNLVCLDFTAGTGLSSFTFSSTGAYGKSWSSTALDLDDYFQAAFLSSSQDTFQLDQIEFGERRSGTGIHDYELRYSKDIDFTNFTSLAVVNVPDNDSERDKLLDISNVKILPGETFYLRWYGYNAESSAGSWRINNGTLKMNLSAYVTDVAPPVLIEGEVINTKAIQLKFDEQIDISSFGLQDFILEGSINPIAIETGSADQGQIELNFANSFPLNQTMTLAFQNISDMEGNVIQGQQSIELIYIPTPPIVIDAVAENDTLISIYFDQVLDSSSFNLQDFRLNETVLPSSLDKNNFAQGLIKLYFSDAFTDEQSMSLKYKNISNLKGDIMEGEKEILLAWYTAKPFYMIVDELLPDPSPVVYMPENEFIEIYNTQDFPLNTRGCQIQVGSSDYTMSPAQIAAKSYLLIVPNGKAQYYDPSLNVVEMNFGELSNSSGTIILKSAEGLWLHQLNYDSDWHTESYKKDGGWSLEMIDKTQFCSGANNWASSVSLQGTTAGYINSIDGESEPQLELAIEEVFFTDSNKVKVVLNQMISPNYSPNSLFFELDQRNPLTSNFELGEQEIVLEFEAVFDTNLVYQLKISDTLRTCTGDYLNIPWSKRLALPLLVDSNDIVISEILFNATSDGDEYVEFYNQSDKIIDLSEMKLAKWDDSKASNLDMKDFIADSDRPIIVYPNEYFVLTKDKEKVLSQKQVAKPDNIFNTDQFLSLSSSEDRIYLLNRGDRIIDQAYYQESFHNLNLSSFDGVSLEKTNLSDDGFCPMSWHSASEESGFGTPTSINSQGTANATNGAFAVANSYFIDSLSVKIRFNQNVSPYYQATSSNFFLNQLNPDTVIYNPGHASVQLNFTQAFAENTKYELEIKDNITTCSGDVLDISTLYYVGIPLKVDSNDLVINEILFNPLGDNKTYIECYNKSNKIIDLSEIKLGVLDDDEINPRDVISEELLVVFPEDYFVLTKDKENVIEQFYVKNPSRLFETSELPSFSSSNDYVYILDRGDRIIDKAYYNSDFHNPILSDNEGVSLEKINPDLDALSASSWHSASQSSGFGTPTYQNSQFSDSDAKANQTISFEYETFSPDMDGYNDYLIINYKLEKSGYAASVKIYNSKGQPIIDLVDKEFTGLQGQWTWEGRDSNQKSSPLGIYILVFEFVHADGEIIQEKRVCTLAGKI